MHGARFDLVTLAAAHVIEMPLRDHALNVPELLLFRHQSPGRLHIAEHEHGDGELKVVEQAGMHLDHVGSVRARASKYRLSWDEANPGSSGLQNGQHGRGPPEVEQSPAIGGNVLVGAGAEAED